MNGTSDEQQYLDLIKTIIHRGEYENTRNGTTLSIFGHSMRFSLRGGVLPLITTKEIAWKTCFHELMWFIRGSIDNRGASPPNTPSTTGLAPLDQLANLICNLKNPTPETSRRLIITAWNPEQIDQMALPPCHIMMQFHVSGGEHEKRRLSCAMYQISCDVALGVPFNIASYSFLTHILAKHCDLEAHEFVYFMGNAHIYEEHLKPIMEQMLRKPHAPPRIQIAQKRENIEDYTLDDIVFLQPYECDAAIPMSMVA
jgi:thymidylate synthase